MRRLLVLALLALLPSILAAAPTAPGDAATPARRGQSIGVVVLDNAGRVLGRGSIARAGALSVLAPFSAPIQRTSPAAPRISARRADWSDDQLPEGGAVEVIVQPTSSVVGARVLLVTPASSEAIVLSDPSGTPAATSPTAVANAVAYAKAAADRAAAEQDAARAAATREAAERAAAERATKAAEAAAAREVSEKAAADRAANIAKLAAEREALERQAAEKASAAARLAGEREAMERETAARAKELDRLTGQRTASEEEAARLAAERVALEKAAAEKLLAATRAAEAREAADRTAVERAERMATLASERELAERAALEAARRAEKAAADRAAREVEATAALTERIAAEKDAARVAGLRAAADREAAERAAESRAAAEVEAEAEAKAEAVSRADAARRERARAVGAREAGARASAGPRTNRVSATSLAAEWDAVVGGDQPPGSPVAPTPRRVDPERKVVPLPTVPKPGAATKPGYSLDDLFRPSIPVEPRKVAPDQSVAIPPTGRATDPEEARLIAIRQAAMDAEARVRRERVRAESLKVVSAQLEADRARRSVEAIERSAWNGGEYLPPEERRYIQPAFALVRPIRLRVHGLLPGPIAAFGVERGLSAHVTAFTDVALRLGSAPALYSETYANPYTNALTVGVRYELETTAASPYLTADGGMAWGQDGEGEFRGSVGLGVTLPMTATTIFDLGLRALSVQDRRMVAPSLRVGVATRIGGPTFVPVGPQS